MPQRTRTIKNKHAANKSGISSSKSSKSGSSDGGSKSKKKLTGAPLAKQVKGRSLADALKKRKKKVYTEKELGIPQLNMITPIGVTKPKGKKKGKVFVDDKESMSTILAMVQADKQGEIESKMIKARQLEEIREARRVESEKKEADKKAKLDETKESLRRKRKRTRDTKEREKEDAAADGITEAVSAGTNPRPSKKKKRVSFA
ncbi:hypothetical protein F5Y16DRAFT_378154 [Xylariaceae sp. FL0255]|nr:hypothetical protein F5Y16DRAFT_378154 [Xylariaceae sp. FL0255]